jgi:hypothetical protein
MDAPPRLHGEPYGWGGDVNTNVQWCSVVRTKLGDTRVVIGGEVDCVKGLCSSSLRLLAARTQNTNQGNIRDAQIRS